MKMQTATDFSSCYLHEEHYMTESQSKVGSAYITNGADAEPRGEESEHWIYSHQVVTNTTQMRR